MPVRRVVGALAGAAVVLALLSSPATGLGPGDDAAAVRDIYLVVLRQAPLSIYRGGLEGYAATAPVASRRFDAARPEVAGYRSYLLREQAKLLADIGSPRPLYAYTTALNGFAAALTFTQVKQLRSRPDVVAVELDRTAHLDAVPASGDLGAGGADGAWKAVGGPASAGEGIVIGVVDSGVWPENPSFAGIPTDADMLRKHYPGFTGTCLGGERWSPESCNAKVIAARYFVRGFGAGNVAAADYLSPRDGSGHGSHTAATAAGNPGVDVTIDQQDFGQLSGIAPAAAVAIYKACWVAPDPDDDGCTTADTVKAIDQAVSDGVDVLNYSASTPDTAPTDVVELAFLNAASAGVFVATSAGDTGSEVRPVAHPSPWVATVGASSHQPYQGAVRLGNGRSYVGAMLFDEHVASTQLTYAADVPAPGVSERRAALCFAGSLDARAVGSAIVVCDRGVTARLDKSVAVAQAGGAAMVLANRTRASTDADFHAVPTVHVTAADGRAIKAYIRSSPRPTAALDGAASDATDGPRVADFSARGPADGTDGDLVKPDLTAPGVSVLAAVAPPSNFGHLWDVYSGTSMAAPHVAGLAALLQARHPTWSPAAIKSAMSTSATTLADSGPWAQGAGDVNPRRAVDPGLVYDAGRAQWLRYLGGYGVAAHPHQAMRSLTGTELNSPAISIGELIAKEQVERAVTNVSSDPESYVARIDAPPGIEVSVSPASFTLAPGDTQKFTVAFSARTAARYQHFAVGSLTWKGSSDHSVRSPLVVRPELVRAPVEAFGAGRRGSLRISERAGVTGKIRTSVVGLVGASSSETVLEPGGFTPVDPRPSASTAVETFTVPTHTAVLRLDLQAESPRDDLDMFVYRDQTLVASADSDAADERLTLDDPRPGDYTVYVNAATSATGDTTSSRLTTWVVPFGDAGTAAAGPNPVTVTGDRPFDLMVSWSGLDKHQRWFGYLDYRGSDQRTYLTIN